MSITGDSAATVVEARQARASAHAAGMREIALRQGQRGRGTHDLEALASEAHAAGDVRIERAANASIGGKLDAGYR